MWVVGASLVGGTLAVAAPKRSPAPTARPILHEDLPPPTAGESPSTLGQQPSPNKNPAMLASGDKIIPEPKLDPVNKGEPLFGGGGVAADRDTQTKPDLNTVTDGALHYASVFNPDVVPFKRMSALDGLHDDYTMVVARPATTAVSVGGHTDPMRDGFWASLDIKVAPGVDVAIPSVAPDMRILSYETSPKVTLSFSKDGADNFYVRAAGAGASDATVRLIFFADADSGYFAATMPSGASFTPRRVRAQTPLELVPKVPSHILTAARQTLAALSINEDTSLDVALNRLVKFFRGFEAKESPPTSGDIYRDLVDHQAGVCRHRSFAFMVTANALGLPTRYVSNEAHAFVEVWLPGRSWQRIDLGGAALRLDVAGGDGKTLHRPRAEDPFDKPSNYDSGYSKLNGEIHGLSQQQLDDKHKSLQDSPASGTPSTGVDAGGNGTGGGSGSGGGGGVGPTPDGKLPPRTADPKKPTPRVLITQAASSGYRGETLHLEGRVDNGKAPVADHAVELYLSPHGHNGADAILIGHGATDARGIFSVDVELPASLDLATYDAYAATRDDAQFNAAISD